MNTNIVVPDRLLANLLKASRELFELHKSLAALHGSYLPADPERCASLRIQIEGVRSSLRCVDTDTADLLEKIPQ